MTTKYISASIPTLKRLPRYLQVLKALNQEENMYISATKIADELKVDSIQVRKDLQSTGIIGKPKLGFELKELIQSIESFLNWDNLTDAFLIGVGSLGQALLGYENFKKSGLNIIAGFDIDEKLVGKTIRGINIYNINKVEDLIKRMKINVAVIALPANNVNMIVEKIVEAGITAIWNFAPVHINTNEDVIIENVNLTQSLAVLTHKINERKNKDGGTK